MNIVKYAPYISTLQELIQRDKQCATLPLFKIFAREFRGHDFKSIFFLQMILPLSCFEKGCADANDGNDPPIEVMVVQLELVWIDTAHSCVTETRYNSERKSVFLTSGLSMTNFSLTV